MKQVRNVLVQMVRIPDHVTVGENFAVVSLLYGCSLQALAQGLALGASLAYRTRHPRILLHTSDVPAEHLVVLRHFWQLRLVPSICGS